MTNASGAGTQLSVIPLSLNWPWSADYVGYDDNISVSKADSSSNIIVAGLL